MSILTDLFAAADGEIDAQTLERGPSARFRTLEAKSVDDVKLTSLNALATGRWYGHGDAFDAEAFDSISAEIPMVRDGGEGGPWIFRLPDALLDEVATADEEQLRELNAAWAQTEEWRADGVAEPDDTLWLVEGLAQLARDARNTGRHVYLWLSL